MTDGQPQSAGAGQAFPCASCGAPEMQYDAAKRCMVCPFCSATAEVPQTQQAAAPATPGQGQWGGPAQQQAQPGAIVEHDLHAGIAQAARGLGTETKTIECSTCGARVSFTGQSTSKACDFCGSPHVLQQESNRNTIRPESLVPFSVDQPTAKQKFSTWIGGLWFRPNDLKTRASVGEINGVYIPYWTFDAHVKSNWTAEAGYHYYVTETYTDAQGQKRSRQVQKTRWEPARGHRQDTYDDVLVAASKGLPPGLAEKMKTFNTQQLVPYEPHYLSGWRAEEYGIDLQQGWVKGKQTMENEQRNRCSRDVPGDTQRNLNVQNHFSSETFKHVLLPLYIASYMYNGKTFRFLVNGQTGEVAGDAPLSWIKITLFALMIMILIGIAVGLYMAFGDGGGGSTGY